MTDRDMEDEKLRQAFQALGETAQEPLSAEDLDQIWRAVSGDLPASERRALVERMASDPGLAEAWRAAHEMRRTASLETPAAAPAGRFWTPSWLAAAAVLVIGIAIGIVVERSQSPEETFRDVDAYVVESLLQPEAALPRDDFRLRWTPGPPDSRYQVRLTTEDLRVLAIVSDLTMPELVVERAVLSSVPSGARVLWQVEATLPGGEVVSSETLVAQMQ